MVVLLVALPLAIAWLFISRHEGATPVPSAVQLSLELKDGIGNSALAACGTTHHYTDYRSGDRIAFDGTVANPPNSRWKVKVKLKSCIGGSFESAGEVRTHRRRGGRYKGQFKAPVPGTYFARAQLNSRKRRLARSEKQFFRIR